MNTLLVTEHLLKKKVDYKKSQEMETENMGLTSLLAPSLIPCPLQK